MPKKQLKQVQISSLKELAAAVGVSTASVSLVLNKKWEKKVKPAIAEKILGLASQHNFSLNPLGKGLTMKKYFRIALVVEDTMMGHPILGRFSFHDFIGNVTHKLNKAGYSLDITQLNQDSIHEVANQQGIPGLSDAYIFIGWQQEHVVELLDNLSLSKPYIVFDTDLDDARYSYVYKDFAKQSELAADHFVANGHQRIGVIQCEDSPLRFQLKLKGFRQGLVNGGFPLDKLSIVHQTEPGSVQYGYASAMGLFSGRDRPTAVFATDNMCTIGVLWALDKLGLRVPEEVEVISYGDEALALQTNPALSYIKIPSKEIAQYCIDRIIEWTEGVHPFRPLQTCFEEKLVFGGTTIRNA